MQEAQCAVDAMRQVTLLSYGENITEVETEPKGRQQQSLLT